MKQLAALVVLLLVLGLMALVYRYEIERPINMRSLIPGMPGAAGAGSTQAACSDEAKVCPDGSAVGRTGASCTFATCPLPNVELTVGSTTIAFVLPDGYTANPKAVAAANDASLLAEYDKASNNPNAPHEILVHTYAIPAGQTAEQVMIQDTTLESSGASATSTAQFKTVSIGGKSFYSIVTERSEGQVRSEYYLYGANGVVRFDVLERDVSDWTDPSLAVSVLPEHQALAQMLATLQVSGL